MTKIRVTTHAVFWRDHPGTPTVPWQRAYFCVCGADLDAFDEQGLGSVDVDAAFTEHMAEVAA